MRGGIALFELIVVLAFLMIIVSLAVPTFSVFDRLLVRAELDTLYLTCASLQQEAQLTGQAKELIFMITQQAYTWGKERHVLHPSVRFGFIQDVKGPPSSPQVIIKHPVTFPSDKIVFHPDGIVQAGSVYLIDKASRFLFALTCPVSRVSYVRRYIYQESWSPIS